ncbi:hypothetical protein [Microbacterium tumbae]
MNTIMTRATALTRWRSNAKSTSPIRLRSGMLSGEPLRAGTVRLQPPALPSAAAPRCQTASTITASTVPETRPMSRPPLTRSATRAPVSSSVTTKSRVGTVATDPPTPRPTGGEAFPVAVTKPEFTKPMKAMNSPIPTVIASLSWIGTASKIALRSPVAASSTMMTPLIMTSAIASAQDTWPTTENATKALIPRPAAKPNGSRVTTPNRIVMTPAVSAVAAPTAGNSSARPSTSVVVVRMIGFRITM